MKKALVLFFAAIGLVSTSHAVVIHWAVNPLPYSYGIITQAELVYVSGAGVPVDASGSAGWTQLANAPQIGTTVSGRAITPGGIGEQASTDTAEPPGNYYVVLFTYNSKLNENILLAYSTVGLASDNGTYITFDPMAPAPGVWHPASGPGAWTPIPEPCSMSLLCVGAATLAIRRRRKQCP